MAEQYMINDLETTLSLLQCTLVAFRMDYTPENISWKQYDILELLQLYGKQNPSSLSKHLGISRPNLSKYLHTLKSLHLIEQVPSPIDKRRLETQLTAKGQDFLKRAMKGRQIIANHVKSTLTKGEQGIFIELCNKINSALLSARNKLN